MFNWLLKLLGVPNRRIISIDTEKKVQYGLFQDLGLCRRENLTVAVATLRQLKNLEQSIHAIACIPGQYLVIFGEGSERGRLQALIDELDVGDRVVLMGMVSRETLCILYRLAGTFLSTSKHEGYGMALREARACGCRVISYIGDGRSEDAVDVVLGDVKEVFG